jgi:parallel beta-helix repeat protein
MKKLIWFLFTLLASLIPTIVGAQGTHYLVYWVNSTYYAKDQDTQKVYYSNTDAAGLLNQLISFSQCQAITLSSGNYPMTATLNLKSHLSLTGLDNARLIQQGSGNMIFGTAVTNCQITNLELAGAGTNIVGRGIYLLTNCKSNSLTQLFVHDFDGDGILLGTYNTQFNVIIGNCVSNCMGGSGIALGSTAGDSIIESNYVYRTRFHGIIISTGGSRCLVAGNTVIDAGYYINLASNDFAHGIAADGGGGAVQGTGNVIIGNVISNSALAGIEVADWQNNCTIASNKVTQTHNGMYGIYFGGGLATSTNCVITGNVVQNADGNGIMIDSPYNGQYGITSSVLISGNSVSNSNGHGILVGLATAVVMTGNTCVNNSANNSGSDGIHVQGRGISSSYIVAFGNQCFDNRGSPRQRYGIYLDYVSHAWACANTLGPNTLTPEKVGPFYIGTTTNMVTITR